MMRTTKSSICSSSRSTKTIPGAKALKSVSNRALLSGIRKLSETERKTVLSILVHLIEIDRRKLYLPLGFSSLYEFCTERLGYSESTAARRISIARCIRDYPAVYRSLSCGKVSMTNLAMITRIMTPENVSDLLCRIEGASKREVELLVSSRRPKSAIRDRVTPVYVKTLLEVRDGDCKSDGDKTNDGNRYGDNTLDGGGKFSTATGGGKNPATSKGSETGSGEGPAASPDTGSRPFAAQTVVFEERLKVTFGADPDFMRKVERVRSLLSSKYHRHLELGELFSLLMDEYIERQSPEGRIRRKEKREKRAEKEIEEYGRSGNAAGDRIAAEDRPWYCRRRLARERYLPSYPPEGPRRGLCQGQGAMFLCLPRWQEMRVYLGPADRPQGPLCQGRGRLTGESQAAVREAQPARGREGLRKEAHGAVCQGSCGTISHGPNGTVLSGSYEQEEY